MIQTAIYLQTVPEERFAWRVDQHQHKEQCGPVLRIDGEQCVTPTGQMQMPKWCVASWVIQVKRIVSSQF